MSSLEYLKRDDKIYQRVASEEHTSNYKLVQIESIYFGGSEISEEDLMKLLTAKSYTIDICGDIYAGIVPKAVGTETGQSVVIGDMNNYGVCITITALIDYSSHTAIYSYTCDVDSNKYARDLCCSYYLRLFAEVVETKKSSDWRQVHNSRSPLGSAIEDALVPKFTDFQFFCYKGHRTNEVAKIFTGNGTNFSYMFSGCDSLRSVPDLDTSNGTDFGCMFHSCSSLRSVPDLDTSNGTDFSYMFYSCTSLTSVPDLDTSNGINFSYMLDSCTSLTSVPDLDTGKGTDFSHMFNSCRSLTSVPDLDTSNGTNFAYMFAACRSLTSVPDLDTSNGTNFKSMFHSCTSLTSVSDLDISNGTNFTDMFYECRALTNLKIKNIKKSLQIGDGTRWGHLLTLESLLFIIGELITATSSQTLTVGSANLEKLANVYVKTIAITDEMRAADANIEAKGPFEVCESTDEGAVLITNYASSKKWVIN